MWSQFPETTFWNLKQVCGMNFHFRPSFCSIEFQCIHLSTMPSALRQRESLMHVVIRYVLDITYHTCTLASPSGKIVPKYICVRLPSSWGKTRLLVVFSVLPVIESSGHLPSVRLSVRPPIPLSIYPSIHPLVHPSFIHSFIPWISLWCLGFEVLL